MANKIDTNKAFPDDTYIKEKKRASRLHHTWIIVCILAILVSIIVDISNLIEIMSRAINDDSLGIPLAIGVSLIYIAFSAVSGHLLRLSITSDENRKLYKTFAYVIICIIIVFLIAIMITRFIINSSNEGSDLITSFAVTIILTLAMAMGAISSLILAYFRKDALAEKLLENAYDNLSNDIETFDKSIEQYKNIHIDKNAHINQLADAEENIITHLKNCAYTKYKILMLIDDPGKAKGIIDNS